MVEVPTGSLIGLCLVCAVVGVVLGRSGRFMSRLAKGHARVHGSKADAQASAAVEARTGEQTVNVVVGHERASDAAEVNVLRLVQAFSDPLGRVEVGDVETLSALLPGWRDELAAAGWALVPVEAGSGEAVEVLEVRAIEAAK